MALVDDYDLVSRQILRPFEEILYLIRDLDSGGSSVPNTFKSPSNNVWLLVAAPCLLIGPL